MVGGGGGGVLGGNPPPPPQDQNQIAITNWRLGYPDTPPFMHGYPDRWKVRITDISTFSMAELAKSMRKCNYFPCWIIEVLDK